MRAFPGRRIAQSWAPVIVAAICLTTTVIAEAASSTTDLGQENPLDRLPDGIAITTAGDVELSRSYHPTCADCVVVNIHNKGVDSAAATLSVTPLALPVAPDRSFGSWVYSYTREHVGMSGAIDLADPDSNQKTTALGSRTRFHLRAASFSGPAANYTTGDHQAVLDVAPGGSRELTLYDGATLASSVTGSPIEDFLYWSLWSPFRWLCLNVERAIETLLPQLGAFGIILLIVLVVRAITFPINRWSFRSQQAFEAVQRDIAPELADIKSRLKGGDQSEAILKLYQARDMNPLSGLKGSVGLFVQIPILVAMFNVASDSAILSQVSMGWMTDIAQPEHTFSWGVDIPLLGNFFNLIALGLAAFMILGELNKPEPSTGNLLFAVAVGILLYSFPTFLVVYWLLISVAQKVEQMLTTRSSEEPTQ